MGYKDTSEGVPSSAPTPNPANQLSTILTSMVAGEDVIPQLIGVATQNSSLTTGEIEELLLEDTNLPSMSDLDQIFAEELECAGNPFESENPGEAMYEIAKAVSSQLFPAMGMNQTQQDSITNDMSQLFISLGPMLQSIGNVIKNIPAVPRPQNNDMQEDGDVVD